MFLFLLFLVSWLVSLLVASGALGELGGHISCLVAVGCHLLQVVGEEEHLQYGEYDEQLYDDDCPQGASQPHLCESVFVE